MTVWAGTVNPCKKYTAICVCAMQTWNRLCAKRSAEFSRMEDFMETKKRGRAVDYLKGIGFGILMIFLFYVVQFAVMFVVIVVNIVLGMSQMSGDMQAVMASYMDEVQSPEFLTMATAFMTAATTLVFGLWYKLQYGRKFMKNHFDGFKERVLTGKNILVFFLLGVACYYIELDISSLIALVSPDAMESFQELMADVTGGSPLVSLIFVVILAPIGEECLFRGLVQRKFLKWMPVVPALILQAVIFGVFHLNIVQGIYVLILGLAAGYVAYRCNSVLPAIFIHFVNNGWSMLMGYLPESILNIDILWILMPIVPIALLVLVVKFMPGSLMEGPKMADDMPAEAVPVLSGTKTEAGEV